VEIITKMRVLAVALAAVLLAGGCGGNPAEREAVEETGPFAYRLSIEGWEAWAAPSTGSWRSQGVDDSGVRQVHVYSQGAYFRSIGDEDTSARVGSAVFLGANGREPTFMAALRAREPLRPGDEVEGMRVEERISLTAAERRGLFDVPVTEAAWSDRELDPGEAASQVKAYWFGPALAGREAFFASEHSSPDETVHVTCYGDPEELAAARSHCLPGQGEPRRELQIISRPLGDELAGREVARLERDGTGRPIRLANGEAAVLYGHAILTKTTLITFAGRIELAEHLGDLRPLRTQPAGR
jgi:hypothetical protein